MKKEFAGTRKKTMKGKTPNAANDRENANTGVLILQNAKGLFLSQDLARASDRAESAEILHGTLLRDSTWVNRGVF